MASIKRYFIPTFFVLPMILHWILPWGMESKLYFPFFGISLYLPDIFYFFYLIWYNFKSKSINKLPYFKRNILIALSIIITAYSWLILISKDVIYIPDLIINNLSFVWLPLIFLLAPLSPKQIQLTKPAMLGALLILIAEVLLYSLGILHYTTDAGNLLSGQDYGGVMRISTTIGAATGTAVIIGLLGAIVISIYNFTTKGKILLFIFTSLGVYFTMSRGTSLVWTFYMIYYFYIQYFNHIKLSKKLKALLITACLIVVFYEIGGFNPIINRYEHMERSSDMTASRASKWDISMRMIKESSPWGYGLGQVMPEKAIEMSYRTPYHFAPHNAYTLIAIELGTPGLTMFIVYIITILSCISFKNPLSFYILLVLIINANTESFVLESEAFSLFMFAIMSISKYKYKTNYHSSIIKYND